MTPSGSIYSHCPYSPNIRVHQQHQFRNMQAITPALAAMEQPAVGSIACISTELVVAILDRVKAGTRFFLCNRKNKNRVHVALDMVVVVVVYWWWW